MRSLPIEVWSVASVDEGQHLRHHIWMKILNVHLLAFFLRHVCVEHCSEDWRSRITMIEHVNKSSFSPGRQHELVTVKDLVSTLDLDVAELLVDERVLQVLTQLLVSVRLLLDNAIGQLMKFDWFDWSIMLPVLLLSWQVRRTLVHHSWHQRTS